MNRICCITGCSSGVGKSLSLLLGKAYPDVLVYATMRNIDGDKGKSLQKEINENNLSNVKIASLDVTSDTSVNNFYEQVKDENTGNSFVSVLVNNAGYAIQGTHEMNSIQECEDQFATNFYGVIRVQNKFLPEMRKNKLGHIIGVSSVGGLVGVPFNDVYCASKFALEGLYESMASLNQQFNIQTSLVEPGAINTDFVENAQRPDSFPDDGLEQLYQKYHKAMSSAFDFGQTSEEVATVVLDSIVDGFANKAQLRYQTSDLAKQTASAILCDPTGNTVKNLSTARFFGDQE